MITIKSSKTKYIPLLLAAVAFVACGIFLLFKGKPDDVWIGWMCIIFFGAGIPLFAREIFRSTPRLTVNEIGVLDSTLGVGLIPWTEITGAYVMTIHNSDFICLELRDPEPWVKKLSPIKRAAVSANRALGFTEISLNLSGLKAETRDIFELIVKMAAAARRS